MNNLCHIAHYSMGHLENDDDKRTGVIFGVFKQLLSLFKKFKSNNFILCWDSRLSYRKQIFPEYKAQRKKNITPEQEKERKYLYDQISQLRSEIMPEVGFKNNFIKTGYEADDLIAKFIIDYRNEPDSNFLIISTDQDLFQILSKNVRIYNVIKKEMITEEWFMEKWEGLLPINFRSIKSIAGCSSDNIPPIEKGIGEKTALKYVLGKCDEFLIKKIKNCSEVRERNFKLVSLPFNNKKNPLPILDLAENNFRIKMFQKWFNLLGFDYFIKNFNEWEKFIGHGISCSG